MKNYKKIILPAFLMVLTLASCEKSEEEPWNPDAPTISNGAYILNQGNAYNHIEGSLNLIDYTASKSSQSVFKGANGRTLGDSPQCGVAYGSKLYIGMSESRTIEIVDRSTYKSLKQIRLDDVKFNGKSPRSMVANDGEVYISMYEGYVAKLDTLSAAISAEVKVGPNPEIMCLHKGKLYVPNSDGNNYMVSYGKTASVIDIDTFTVTDTFETGLNPYEFFSDGNNLFLMDVVGVEDTMLDDLDTRESHIRVRQLVDECLTEREADIIRQRYGLGGKAPRTQRELAAEYGISRSYVSRRA